MHKESYIGLAIEVLAIGGGVWQSMTGTIPPVIGWSVIGICVIVGFTLIIIGLRKKEEISDEKDKLYSYKWEHYNKLTEHILALENAPKENIAIILADIQRELVEIGDNQIDKLLSLFSDAVDESDEFDLNPMRWEIRIILERTRERMNKKYPRRILKSANNE